MNETVVFRARRVLTMDPNRPVATHVAVRDGRILAVGDVDVAAAWGGGKVDDRLADAILMPGFVDGHAHMMAGAMWRYFYAGFQDRLDPNGKLWKGLADIGAVIRGLREAEARLPEDAPLVGWGFDPIFLPTERLNRKHLDAVSSTRPIVIMHSNFHLMTVNSAALALAGYTRDTNAEGVLRGPDGEPNGELQEMAAMFPVMRRLQVDFRALSRQEESIRAFGQTAMRVGVTTSADLINDLQDDDVATLLSVTSSPGHPLRIVPALNGMNDTPDRIAARALELRPRSSDMLRLGAVKLMTDGSIQGYTARLKWPGYVNGAPNGIWNTPPEKLDLLVDALHAAGIQMHIHVNGDEASDVAIASIEKAVRKHGGLEHRHTLQHCQMADEAQFRRMATVGLCANLFSNHIWFFGDQHLELTIGEDRARRLDAARSALDHAVPLAIHSDAPVTPMGPLQTAWCAVNRTTPKGRVLGEGQRISVAEALRAITVGAAYTLGLDGEIGSIETGKKADFAILGDDPAAVAPEVLHDVPVLGTVSGGRIFLA
jgi:predicted amidohydrolase YtcJ